MDENLKQKILGKIKPSDDEHSLFVSVVDKFINQLKNSADEVDIDCDFFLGGSFGKNTYLKGSFDVDIFCRQSLIYDDCELSPNLLEILENAKIDFKVEKGSRNYYSFEIERGAKVKFEVIPVRKIKNNCEALNSTDFSPFHVEFLKEKLKENTNLCDEIRLAKQFFKAKNLYGAESYVNGFSGHVIDNLIMFYGSLENLINSANSWEENHFIDINNNYKNLDEAILKIGDSKASNLVLIDPILENRNAARAISTQSYNEFLFFSQSFNDFIEEDFIIRKIQTDNLILDSVEFAKKNNFKLLMYKFDIDIFDVGDDIAGSKLKKLFGRFEKYFENFDFKVFDKTFHISFKENICIFIFQFETSQIPEIKKLYGPKIFMKEFVEKFLRKNRRYENKIENDRIVIFKNRDITKLTQISEINLIKCKELLEKDLSFIKKVRLLK